MTACSCKCKNSQVFESLSAHLDRLAEQVCDIEEALGLSLPENSTACSISITKFQSLDFIRQSLEDCALLVHFLSLNRDGNCVSDTDTSTISSKLKLDATKSILQPNKTREPERNAPSGGDLDLF